MSRQPRSRDMRGAGGMLRLPLDGVDEGSGARVLDLVPLEGLTRFAAWLGVAPAGPWPTEAAQRGALMVAIMRAEARLARMPRERRLEAGALRTVT